jgi:TonB family protein
MHPERIGGVAPIDALSMSLRRSPLAIAISASVHVCALAAIVWMSSLAPVRVPRAGTPASLIYNVFIPPPVHPVVLERQVTRLELPPPPPKVDPPEESPNVAVAAPPPPPEVHRADPIPPPSETPPSEPAPRPEPPRAPAARPLVVGTFEQTTTTARNVEPPREVQTTGFDMAQARTTEAKLSGTTVGAFDSTAGGSNPQPGNQRTARVVAAAGFNSDASPAQTQRPALNVVRDAGFDAAAPAPQHAASRRQEPIDVPVEVLFKPTPSYSTEARALKIEGEVALEVEFLATTKVRVVRVLRGLGHGLDEAAVQAAEQIRFTPAQSGGRPVDVRTTVHIVFKLA